MADEFSGLDPEKYKEITKLLKEHGLEVKKTRDGYKSLSNEAYKYLKSIKDSYSIQKEMKAGVDGLVGALKEISNTQKKIKAYEKEISIINEKMITANEKQKKQYKEVLKALNEEISGLKTKQKLLEDNYKAVSKTGVVFREMTKVVANLPGLLEKGFGKLKGTGIFEMDKAIKTSALSMGLLGARSGEFSQNIKGAQDSAIALGTTIQDLAQIQATYSDELGRAVLLSEKSLDAVSRISKGTGIGAEAAAKMAGEFDAQGVSAEKTADFVEQTMNDASSMGLNASKVIKNIQGNIKLLNKYNFKGGVKGLAKMAETVAKLGLDMNSVAPMADKLFNVEGAVEMSAQLQVLGGRWSQLADPFKLMYQARNDMDGLVKSIGEAAAESASLDEDGNIKLASVEMARLRQVAETTGISYEDLAEAAKRAGKASIIKGKISMTGLSEKEQEFLANTAEFENGKAFIKIGGEKKFLNELDGSAKSLIDAKMAEQKTLKERAEAAMSFDEQMKSIFDQFKQYLLPIATELAKGFGENLKKFRAWMDENKIGEKIQKAAKTIGEVISGFLGFVTNHPILTLSAVGGAKLFGFLWEKGMWIKNGIDLSTGFKMGMGGGPAGGGPGGIGGKIGNKLFGAGDAAAMEASGMGTMGKIGANFKSGLKSFGAKGSGLLAAGIEGYSEYNEQMEKGKGQGEAIGRAALKGTGAGLGAWGGAAAGAAIGSVVPVVGTLIGGLIGGALGAWGGGKIADLDTYGVDDGVVFNPRDKFMKVNDATMIAGTNVDGNKSLAKALMTTMTPAAQTSSIPGTLKLSDLNVSGIIELKMNGNSSSELGKELLNDPIFIRNISRAINMATSSAFSGTQPQKPLR